MRNFVKSALVIALAAALASCSSKTYEKINYFQDIQSDTTMVMAINNGVVIQPLDQLSIIVSHRSPELASQFNLPVATYQAGSEFTTNTSGTHRLVGYVVDNNGDISFPQLGKIHVAGMNRWDLQKLVADRLASNGLLSDAIVTVEFMNFRISVLGEVSSPGTYTIAGDKITIDQAIAMARDLTIHGQRENVKVIRERNGEMQAYVVDLTNFSELRKSPAYYLQQNDVVYVTPSVVRAGQSTINENYFKSAQFWVSMSSVAFSATSLAVTLLNYFGKNK